MAVTSKAQTQKYQKGPAISLLCKHAVKIFESITKVLFWGICTLLFIFLTSYFYFTTFLKKMMYFLLHTFSLTPKIHTLVKRTSLVIPTASDLADSLNNVSVGVPLTIGTFKQQENGAVWFA